MNKRRVLCYGDSNTYGYAGVTLGRYADDERWTGILQAALSETHSIIEEGLCGRTTVFDDPFHEGLNGLTYLQPCLESQSPLDLLIIMLGTNDMKDYFSCSAAQTAMGLQCLIQKAKALDVWRERARILLLAPLVIGEGVYRSWLAAAMGAGAVEKSRQLPRLCQELAEQEACYFFDINPFIGVNDEDFMHLDQPSQRRLGEALAHYLRDLAL